MIVTGGGKGLGNAVATAMTKRGAITYSLDKKFTEPAPQHLSKNLFQKKCDITDKKAFESLIKQIFLKHKKIDTLFKIGRAHV